MAEDTSGKGARPLWAGQPSRYWITAARRYNICHRQSRNRMKAIVYLVVLVGAPVVVAQGTLNLSRDLVRLRIASSNMVPNQPDLDSGPLFSKAVAYASNQRFDRV